VWLNEALCLGGVRKAQRGFSDPSLAAESVGRTKAVPKILLDFSLVVIDNPPTHYKTPPEYVGKHQKYKLLTQTTRRIKMENPKYPEVKVQLVGLDGNAWSIMARVSSALKKAGVSEDEVSEYLTESQSGDYDNLLRTAIKWVSVD
jgi:hypothetical protein